MGIMCVCLLMDRLGQGRLIRCKGELVRMSWELLRGPLESFLDRLLILFILLGEVLRCMKRLSMKLSVIWWSCIVMIWLIYYKEWMMSHRLNKNLMLKKIWMGIFRFQGLLRCLYRAMKKLWLFINMELVSERLEVMLWMLTHLDPIWYSRFMLRDSREIRRQLMGRSHLLTWLVQRELIRLMIRIWTLVPRELCWRKVPRLIGLSLVFKLFSRLSLSLPTHNMCHIETISLLS